MVSTYRGKGKDFTITSSTAFDQKWINGKNTYDSISNVVDEIFNSYLSRPEVTQPILTQYCDGKRVSCPEFMSQWGSKALGDDGLSAIEILRYYYGDDMYINEAETISGIPASYPGYELTIGASGQKVRQMQEQLNVIAGDYPLIPKIRVDGIYGPATGIEVYHNYTLLHDDLMDRADVRRGKATVHKVWDDNTAILSGDAMLVLAYQYMADCPSENLKQVMDIFSLTALEICEGQQMDMEFERRSDVREEEYIEMIRLKTAVLLAAGLKIGAILGGASSEDAEKLYDFGVQIGIAFQLQDDLLDVYGDSAVFGKKIGGDILCNKKTYMLIKALERADKAQLSELNDWLAAESFSPEEKIAAVTALYNQIGIKAICENRMREYYTRAMESLEAVSVAEEKKKELKSLMKHLMYREM